MSSRRVKKITRELDYTATYSSGTGLLTVTTATHYLTSTNKVRLYFADAPQELNNVTATVTSSTTFTIPLTAIEATRVQAVGKVVIDFYGPSQTGVQEAFTIPRGQGSGNLVIQSYVTGTGGATYTLELSLDAVHWITAVATVTHSGTSGDTAFITVDPAWAYARINPSAIGAATQLTILLSV